MDPDPDTGGPKTCGSGGSESGFGSGSATLLESIVAQTVIHFHHSDLVKPSLGALSEIFC